MFLTPDELVELTHKQRPAAQIRALRARGIEHRVRPDGKPVVLRSHLEALMGGAKPARRRAEPDWSAAR
jgi:hypothetical protein